MKKLPFWLFPAAAGLFIAGTVLAPQALSNLRDQRINGVVHAETLTGDNNFGIWAPSMSERIDLMVRWQEDSESVSSAVLELTGGELEQVQDNVRAQLGALVDAGVLPPSLSPREYTVTVSQRTYLWTEENLGGTSFLRIEAVREDPTGEGWDCFLSMLVDEESGKAVELLLDWPGQYANAPPALMAGEDFLSYLSVDHELLNSGKYQAFFSLPGSGAGFRIISSGSFFLFSPDTIENIQDMFSSMMTYENENMR